MHIVSNVVGVLDPSKDFVDALSAGFPAGTVSGAPKVRAMEVIGAVEPYMRGPYTGAIGRIDVDGNAAFNVAIRTISVKTGSKTGRIGLGSGVIVDSARDAEWRECLDKGRFLDPLQANME